MRVISEAVHEDKKSGGNLVFRTTIKDDTRQPVKVERGGARTVRLTTGDATWLADLEAATKLRNDLTKMIEEIEALP